MDLPLWEPPDGQIHQISFESNYHVGDAWQYGHNTAYDAVAGQIGYDDGDYGMCDFYFGYGRDAIEEDALNEKSCIQVLRILMDKADDEIIKLEEDIAMLQCQLAWDDDDWSKQCSAALREKIDHLDILIKSLKNEITEDVHFLAVQIEKPEKLAQSLHDFVKPLRENYLLGESKQTVSSTIHLPVLRADGLSEKKLESSDSEHKEKVEEKECVNLPRENERKNPCIKLEERKMDHPQQKFTASHPKRTDKLPEKGMNKLSRPSTPNSAPVNSSRRISSIKPEPSDIMVKASSARTFFEKLGSRERDVTKNNDKVVNSKVKVTQPRVQHEGKVTISQLDSRETGKKIGDTVKPAGKILEMDCEKQITKASIKTYRRAINKNVPSAEIKTKFPKTTKAAEAQGVEMNDGIVLFNHRTKMKLEHKIQNQERHEMETFMINQAKSISSLKPEGQVLQKKRKADSEIVQSIYLGEEISSVENITGQRKFGPLQKMSKIENQQDLSETKSDGASEVNVTSILFPQKKKKSCLDSQTIMEKEKKADELDYDPSKIKVEKALDESGVDKNSLLCIKDVDTLTLNDLKAIAKTQKLRGVYKLRKKQLRERLGLEEPLNSEQEECKKRRILTTNTI